MDKGKMLTRDRQSKVKLKKNAQNVDPHETQCSPECSPQLAVAAQLVLTKKMTKILAKIKSFQQDNKQQLWEIREEIGWTVYFN